MVKAARKRRLWRAPWRFGDLQAAVLPKLDFHNNRTLALLAGALILLPRFDGKQLARNQYF
jgi:hypothetical protein